MRQLVYHAAFPLSIGVCHAISFKSNRPPLPNTGHEYGMSASRSELFDT